MHHMSHMTHYDSYDSYDSVWLAVIHLYLIGHMFFEALLPLRAGNHKDISF